MYISINYDIYKSFDENPSLEARGIFLNMSKAFDRVWHEGLLFNLGCVGLSGKYYGLINSFLRNRHQKLSSMASCPSGVPSKPWSLIDQLETYYFS